MLMPTDNRPNSQRGQTLVMAALLLVVLLLFLGLLIDGGYALAQRRVIQNAADAAALAGAYSLGQGASQATIWSIINDYAVVRNGAGSFGAVFLPGGQAITPGAGTPPEGTTGVRVIATKNYSTFLMGIVGHTTVRVDAVASARAQSSGNCLGGHAIWADKTDVNQNGSDVQIKGGVSARGDLTWNGSNTTITGDIYVNCDMSTFNGSGNRTNGRFHTNGAFDVNGSSNTFNGRCEYGTTSSLNGSSIVFIPSLPGNLVKVPPAPLGPIPVQYDIVAYRPGGTMAQAAQAAGKYHRYDGNMDINQSNYVLDGLYYVTGNVRLNGSNPRGVFTIVAEGSISVNGSSAAMTPYSDGLLYMSNNSTINLNGSGTTWGGIVFAPRGQITMNGSNNFTHRGSLIGARVAINGSGWTLQFDSQYCPASTRSSVRLSE